MQLKCIIAHNPTGNINEIFLFLHPYVEHKSRSNDSCADSIKAVIYLSVLLRNFYIVETLVGVLQTFGILLTYRWAKSSGITHCRLLPDACLLGRTDINQEREQELAGHKGKLASIKQGLFRCSRSSLVLNSVIFLPEKHSLPLYEMLTSPSIKKNGPLPNMYAIRVTNWLRSATTSSVVLAARWFGVVKRTTGTATSGFVERWKGGNLQHFYPKILTSTQHAEGPDKFIGYPAVVPRYTRRHALQRQIRALTQSDFQTQDSWTVFFVAHRHAMVSGSPAAILMMWKIMEHQYKEGNVSLTLDQIRRQFKSDYGVSITQESAEAAKPFTVPTWQEQEEEVVYALQRSRHSLSLDFAN
ncbi:hypothetical protein B0H17DRAFT_1139998 [Mycena rosella]|uniref:Uncharacterized protein n=1 Tax=Mycena rosella TaxID=1033263 RepID=A0AAD7GBV9_MYCRO|nr:hypothetical protein B0H17DRAFT_1139998 [Mycena rosella]